MADKTGGIKPPKSPEEFQPGELEMGLAFICDESDAEKRTQGLLDLANRVAAIGTVQPIIDILGMSTDSKTLVGTLALLVTEPVWNLFVDDTDQRGIVAAWVASVLTKYNMAYEVYFVAIQAVQSILQEGNVSRGNATLVRDYLAMFRKQNPPLALTINASFAQSEVAWLDQPAKKKDGK